MSSGEDDAPLPDDSQPSYDGYKYKRSSSEEEVEGDAPIYPVDDLAFHEDMLGDLNSQASFTTDKFPDELTLPPMIRVMGGTLGALNRKVFAICEDSRRLVNQIYRTDAVLRNESYLDAVWGLKHECYTNLLKLNHGNSGLEALLRKICLLGGPYYKPPGNLWNYLHFFWYDSASDGTDCASITPEPDCAPPDFHTKFCGQIGDIDMIIDALKEEEFAIAPELDKGENNMALVADFKSLSLMAEQYWKSHLADLLPGSTTSDITAGLYAELLRMEEVTKKKISTLQSSDQSCCRFPTLLDNALKRFKEEKEKLLQVTKEISTQEKDSRSS